MITPAGVVTTLAGTAGTAGSADGTGAAALFRDPTGVAYDPTTGDLFVADAANDTIRMITSAGVVTTLAGTAGTAVSANGTGAAALFNDPTGVVVDPTTGNVYVADFLNNTIRMITPAGVVTTLAGTAGTAGSADGTGAAASFNGPTGVAYDPTTSDLFVADAGNDTIRMITSAGVVTTLAGTAGTRGSADGTGAAASFNDPTGVAVDTTTGNLYVGDTGNDTIRTITTAGVVTTLAGTAGTTGSANGTGAAASFDDPTGVAFDPTTDTLFVGDITNDTIRSLSPPTATAQAGLTGTTAQAVNAALTGLLPATTYYFRAVATSAGGTADGDIMSFTTTSAAIAPTATTQAATSVTGTTATLNGTVNPEGFFTTADFVYGTSPTLTTGTTTIPIPPLTVGSGTTRRGVDRAAQRSAAEHDLLLPGRGDQLRRHDRRRHPELHHHDLDRHHACPHSGSGHQRHDHRGHGQRDGQPQRGRHLGLFRLRDPARPHERDQQHRPAVDRQRDYRGGGDRCADRSHSGHDVLLRAGGHQQRRHDPRPDPELHDDDHHHRPVGHQPPAVRLPRPTDRVRADLQRGSNPTSAQNVNNYQIVTLVNGQPGSPIPIASAVYDSTNDTVTIMTVNRVYLYGQYQLTVTGTSPSGVSSSTGQFLSGAGAGQPGTNYVQSFGESILAGPNLDPPMSRVARGGSSVPGSMM